MTLGADTGYGCGCIGCSGLGVSHPRDGRLLRVWNGFLTGYEVTEEDWTETSEFGMASNKFVTTPQMLVSRHPLDILSWRDAEIPREGWKSRIGGLIGRDGASKAAVAPDVRPSAVGREKDVQGKLDPHMVDLAPILQAYQAVDLSLKLMRWRIVLSLDLDRIAATRGLLLGAAMPGCYVARCLMGWGLRTLVD
ncbi:hypothetical protein EDD18DRAFT_1364780 [Armillaria luteobubalina]|uniref:Uncharacterized protein n=1 Tax=Armillaria luteobubalina TaxID=153913 RepID=A0AA39UDC9_9AGAR|nr:hypothetical protein EDD18DRAFT_1364780 [Armillaria luteobubalina]